MPRAPSPPTPSPLEDDALAPPSLCQRALRALRRRVVGMRNTTLGSIALLAVLRMVACEPVRIEGASMEATLLHGERALVAKYAYGLTPYGMSDSLVRWSTPRPGDVVILRSTTADAAIFVKRVIGIPGDTIEFRGDRPYRNGEALRVGALGPCAVELQHRVDERCERYAEEVSGRRFEITQSSRFRGDDSSAPVRVPKGHIYVLGDHRDESLDSRALGPVPLSRVRGRVERIYRSQRDDGSSRDDRRFQRVE